jgi:hypothetical protein
MSISDGYPKISANMLATHAMAAGGNDTDVADEGAATAAALRKEIERQI